MDPRTEATRAALIEAGEALFGHHGFHAVSMKEIGAAIGSRNKVVVAYHFGTKDDLIDAIYAERLPRIEARRAHLLAELRKHGREDDLAGLLDALWRPLAEITNGANVHSYALFLGEMLRDSFERTRAIIHSVSPATRHLVDRINPQLPRQDQPLRDLRWQLASRLILDAIRFLDEGAAVDADEATFNAIFEDGVAMAMAALTAPVRHPSLPVTTR